MSRADEKFQGKVEHVGHLHVAWQRGRVSDGAERGVDIACLDSDDRHAWVVGSDRHHVKVGFRMQPPVVVEDDGLRAPKPEDVDPQCS
jgi:hypothetical protein